jgi:energy-converting hydrogenase Eha subunit A
MFILTGVEAIVGCLKRLFFPPRRFHMGINLTLLLNVSAVGFSAAATSIVTQMPLPALSLAFVAGVAVTISSHYAFIFSNGESDDTSS